MINKKIEKALNRQVVLEAEASQYYLAMASWAENNGYNGVAAFFYRHSDEERIHMLKLIKYINERGGCAEISALSKPRAHFSSLNDIFQDLLKQEITVSGEINDLIEICLKEKDYTTHNFLQWYVAEQIEEEALARTMLDKLKLIGSDKGGLYLFDRDLSTFQASPSGDGNKA
ncbi:MAG: ferritin [Bacteroidetes bacterium]|nr:ferritin [Bacteroidota bacterium]